MMKITTMWVYRLRQKPTMFGLDLEVYSKKQNAWVHMAYFKPAQIQEAKRRYNQTMGRLNVAPIHLEFSFNNLIEIKKINAFTQVAEVTKMLADVEQILDIEIEVIT